MASAPRVLSMTLARTRPMFFPQESWYAAGPVPAPLLEPGGPVPGVLWEMLGYTDPDRYTYTPYPEDWRPTLGLRLGEALMATERILGIRLRVIRGFWPPGETHAGRPSVERWHARGRAVDVVPDSPLSLTTLAHGIVLATMPQPRGLSRKRRNPHAVLPWRGVGVGRGHLHLDIRTGPRWSGMVVSSRHLPHDAGRTLSGVGLTPGAPRPAPR